MLRSFSWIEWPARCSRATILAISGLLLLLIGLADYLITWEISLAIVYVYPIAIAAWYVGAGWAYAFSLVSIVLFTAGDVAQGQPYSSWLIPEWNAFIRLALYAVVIQLLTHIRSLTEDLEIRVFQRTSDLRKEIGARERLERELLEVGARERRRLGFDLHDGLCQHLTGTALAVHVLKEKLASRGMPEAKEAAKAVDLIEDGIMLSRKMAKGLQPVEMHAGGLMQALQEFAASTTDLFKVNCKFECESPILVADVSTADHLYHIAREATGNGIKHGHARNVVITLEAHEDGSLLTITDDGKGIPMPLPKNGGMGLTIMAQRAKLIGATFDIRRNEPGGTLISCCLPHQGSAAETAEKIARRDPHYA